MSTRNWFFKLGDELSDQTAEQEAPTPAKPASATEQTNVFEKTELTVRPPPRSTDSDNSVTRQIHLDSVVQLPEQLAATRECPLPPEMQPKVVVTAPTAAAPPPAARAAVDVSSSSTPPIVAPAAATNPQVLAAKHQPASTTSATMNAYVAPGAQLGPLTPAARSALQGAQSQLKGSAPMQLAGGSAAATTPAKPEVAAKPAVPAGAPQKVQPILLAGVAALVLAAVLWNFYLGSPQAGKNANSLQATSATLPTPPPPPPHEEVIPCLTDSTQYRSSSERDELLRNVVGEFSQGRLERAHAILKEYQQMGCDRATLEAIAILERQLAQKSKDR